MKKAGKLFFVCLMMIAALSMGTMGVQAASLKAPTISKGSNTTSGIKITWKKESSAKGYYVYRGTKSSSLKKIATVKSSKTSYTDTTAKAGKTYYYAVASYSGNKKARSETVKVRRKSTIEMLSSSKYYAISTDVTLASTSCQGAHAKIVIGTGSAAVSFGIQYDKGAVSPYTGKSAFLIENITSGSQKYSRYKYNGSRYASRGKKYTLTLAVQRSTGKVTAYVNDTKVGSVTNSELKNKTLSVWVEASAKKNKDKLDAKFTNISVIDDEYKASDTPKVSYTQAASGLSLKNQSGKTLKVDSAPSTVRIRGTLKLSSSKDWDSAPDQVNGYVRFY